jgi:hypothetical protein
MIKESRLVKKKRTTRGKGKKDRMEWALVSKTNPKKILRWFGTRKPSKKRVADEERRVRSFASDDLIAKKLIVLANELDDRGFVKEADAIDGLILKTSHDFEDDEEEEKEPIEKLLTVFFLQSANMGIQLADMTPGLEKLTEDMKQLKKNVNEYIKYYDALNMPLVAVVSIKTNLEKGYESLKDESVSLLFNHFLEGSVRIVDGKSILFRPYEEWQNMLINALFYMEGQRSGLYTNYSQRNKLRFEALKDWAGYSLEA